MEIELPSTIVMDFDSDFDLDYPTYALTQSRLELNGNRFRQVQRKFQGTIGEIETC